MQSEKSNVVIKVLRDNNCYQITVATDYGSLQVQKQQLSLGVGYTYTSFKEEMFGLVALELSQARLKVYSGKK